LNCSAVYLNAIFCSRFNTFACFIMHEIFWVLFRWSYQSSQAEISFFYFKWIISCFKLFYCSD
jgi:hypothetical protein